MNDAATPGSPLVPRVPERAQSRWDVSSEGIRQAALMFLASSLIGWGLHVLPTISGMSPPTTYAGEIVNGLVGIGAWWGASRSRLRPVLALALPLAAIANLGWTNWLGGVPTATLGTWLVLVYVWMGLWLPRGAAALSAPFSIVVYLASFWFGQSHTSSDVVSVLVVVPVAVLAGEVIAASISSTREAQASQEKLLGELARFSFVDPLTGIGNRRMADTLLESLAPSDVVVMLDLDNFKTVNDRLGHSVGDEVLRSLGAYLGHAVRPCDGVARVGGEEFLVVLRKLDGGALEAADRLVAGWRATSPLTTISAGAAVSEKGVVPTLTYQSADMALYRAKHGGRDQAAVADERDCSGLIEATSAANAGRGWQA